MAGPGSNNHGRASGAGSNKNTLLNMYSKMTPYGQTAGTPAPADPYSYGSYASSVMGLQQQLAGAMALARSQNAAARGQYVMSKQQAALQRISDVSGAEGSALQAGVVGSSADLASRSAAVAQQGMSNQQALMQRNAALAASRGQQIQALGAYYGGLGEAQASLANRQAMENIQRYQNDQFDTMQTNFNALRDALLARLKRNRRRDLGTGLPPGTAPQQAPGNGVGNQTLPALYNPYPGQYQPY